MAIPYKVMGAALEQRLFFENGEIYRKYLSKLIDKGKNFEVIDEKKGKNGEYIVIVRTQHQEYPFIRIGQIVDLRRFKVLAGQRVKEKREK